MKRNSLLLVVVAIMALLLNGCEPLHGDRTAEAVGDGTYLDGYVFLRGINLYSLEEQRSLSPDQVRPDDQASLDYLSSRGFKIVRLAVVWQQLVPLGEGASPSKAINGPIDEAYVATVREEVSRAARAGMRTVIDLHSDCVYPWTGRVRAADAISCGEGISKDDVTRVWSSLSTVFRKDPRVAAYDLFNEPSTAIDVSLYKSYVQAAVDAIRSTGDQHTIWVDSLYGTASGTFPQMAPQGPWLKDPDDALEYSQHFYASNSDRRSLTVRLSDFGEWCTSWHVRCAVGEVGLNSSDSPSGDQLLSSFYSLADSFKMDVTYFGAAPRPVAGHFEYGSSPGSHNIDSAGAEASIIERHPSMLVAEGP